MRFVDKAKDISLSWDQPLAGYVLRDFQDWYVIRVYNDVNVIAFDNKDPIVRFTSGMLLDSKWLGKTMFRLRQWLITGAMFNRLFRQHSRRWDRSIETSGHCFRRQNSTQAEVSIWTVEHINLLPRSSVVLKNLHQCIFV